MTDKLKFTLTYGKTVNLGNYESKKLTVTREFYVDDSNMNYEVDVLVAFVEGTLEMGPLKL